MKRVIIQNRAPQLQTFNLPHSSYCAALGSCECTLVGELVKRRVCRSLILPGGTQVEVPEAVLVAPDVVRAMGRLSVVVEMPSSTSAGPRPAAFADPEIQETAEKPRRRRKREDTTA